jgi:nitrogen-specific signal transduction histidine kinase
MSLSVGELQLDGLMVHMELDPALPTIRGDRVQLQQVILNLILNASAWRPPLGRAKRARRNTLLPFHSASEGPPA